MKKINSTIWQINISQLEKLLNILGAKMGVKNEKLNSKLKSSLF